MLGCSKTHRALATVIVAASLLTGCDRSGATPSVGRESGTLSTDIYCQFDCGGGGGGGDTQYNPDNCAATEIDCQLVPGDYSDDLLYTSGGGSYRPWTHYPWTCVQVGQTAIWSSPVDGQECDTWQIVHYFGQYCNMQTNTCQPATQTYTNELSIGISTAGSSVMPQIPTAGHLYVQEWYLGVPTGNPYQGELDPSNGKLWPGSFSQSPLRQPHFFLPIQSASVPAFAAALQQATNVYEANGVEAPSYNPATMNSNTYADGLLLNVGVSEANIDSAVQWLTNASGLHPYAYSNGYEIENLF